MGNHLSVRIIKQYRTKNTEYTIIHIFNMFFYILSGIFCMKLYLLVYDYYRSVRLKLLIYDKI